MQWYVSQQYVSNLDWKQYTVPCLHIFDVSHLICWKYFSPPYTGKLCVHPKLESFDVYLIQNDNQNQHFDLIYAKWCKYCAMALAAKLLLLKCIKTISIRSKISILRHHLTASGLTHIQFVYAKIPTFFRNITQIKYYLLMHFNFKVSTAANLFSCPD